MIEQGIYFALGCVVMGLLALLFAPVFWRRALRLTRDRLQLQVPLSMQEILAERDQLRAGFAVETLRVEQRMERLRERQAEDMAALGRHSIEAGVLKEQIASLRRADEAREQDLIRLRRETSEATAASGALQVALHDAEATAQGWRRRADEGGARLRQHEAELETQAATLAASKAATQAAESRLVAAQRAIEAETDTAAALRAKLETAMSHVARHENAGLLLRRELDDAKANRRQLEEDLVAARASLREARTLHASYVDQQRHLAVGQEAANAAVKQDVEKARERIVELGNELRDGRVALKTTRRELEESTAAQTAKFIEYDRTTEALRREVSEGQERIRALEAELDMARTALGDGVEREKVADFQRILQADQARSLDASKKEARVAKARIQKLQADLAEARQTLEGARSDRQRAEEARAGLLAAQATAGASSNTELAAASARARQLEAELASGQEALSAAHQEHDRLGAAVRRQRDEHEVAMAALQREVADAQVRMRQLEGDLTIARNSLGDAQDREQAGRLQRSLQADKMRRDERMYTERLDKLAAEKTALQNSLASLQRDGDGPGPAPAPRPEDDLRESIHSLGVAVARLSGQERSAQERSAQERSGQDRSGQERGAPSRDDDARRTAPGGAPRPIGVA